MHRLYGENADRLGQSFSTPKVTLNVGNKNKMHIKSYILILFLSLSSAVNAGLILNEGESYIYAFDSISTIGFANPSPSTSYLLNEDTFVANMADLKFTLFDGKADESTVVSTGDFTTTLPRGILFGLNYNPWWQDLEGSIKIEVTRGSIELESFTVITQIGNHNYYKQTYAVPEPNSVALLFVGFGVFYLRKKKIPTSGWRLS